MMKKLLILSLAFHCICYAQNAKQNTNHINITDSLIELGEVDKAISFLENNLKLELRVQKKFECLALLCNIHKENRNLSLALKYGHLALPIVLNNKLDSLEFYGDILYNIAVSKYRFGESDSAFFYAEAALKQRNKHLNPTHPKIIQNINALGVFNKSAGNIKDCIKYQEKALSLALNSSSIDYNSVVSSHFSLGNSYEAVNNLFLAQEHFHKALNYFTDSLATREIYKAHIYNSLGVTLAAQKDVESSQEYYLEALKLFTELSPQSVSSISTIQSNIGNNFTNLGSFDEAKKYHEKAIRLVEASDYKNELPWKYFNLGATYLENNEHIKALDILEKSKALNDEINGTKNELASMLLNHIAMVYLNENKNNKARVLLAESLEITKTIFGLKDYNLAEAYYLQGLSYFQDNDYEKCMSKLKNAAEALILSDKQETNYKDAIISRPLLLSISILKEKTLLELHNKTEEINYLHLLLESAKKTNALNEVIVDFYFHESAKISLFNEIDENLHLGIQAAKKLYDIDKNPEYIEQAFKFFEYEKAFLLKQEIQNTQAKKNTNLPDSLIAKENQLKREISDQQNLIFNENDPESESSIKINSKIFRLKRELESLLKKIEREHPKYYALKYKNSQVDYKSIQKNLSEGEITIEYYQYHDNVYSISLSKDKITFHQDSIGQLSNKIFRINQAIRNSSIEEYSNLAYKFYTRLLKPHKTDEYKQIIVIPSKELYYLSFDAFLYEKAQELKYNHLDYLVNKNVISYKNRVANNYFNNATPEKLYLGIKPSFTNTEFAELNGAYQEINSISKKLNGDILINENASKSELFKIISNYKILHFASHSEPNKNNSAYSKIILSAETGDTINSKLYAYEIQNSKLNTELVVLSTCNSGTGDLIKGEGLASLARSFNYAGAKSVLVSLWALPDFSTSKIINSFFEELSNKNKSSALQQAKINYLKKSDEHLSNPIFWAGLIITGDKSSLEIKPEIDSKLYYLLTVLLILGLLFWRKSV